MLLSDRHDLPQRSEALCPTASQTGMCFHTTQREQSFLASSDSIGGLVVKLAVAIREIFSYERFGQPRVRFPADASVALNEHFFCRLTVKSFDDSPGLSVEQRAAY